MKKIRCAISLQMKPILGLQRWEWMKPSLAKCVTFARTFEEYHREVFFDCICSARRERNDCSVR
ncbi:hypothetical protein SuNHUV7_20420 (plasmid) [Pseudoseohaeicola sp. NH-UV-7]